MIDSEYRARLEQDGNIANLAEYFYEQFGWSEPTCIAYATQVFEMLDLDNPYE